MTGVDLFTDSHIRKKTRTQLKFELLTKTKPSFTIKNILTMRNYRILLLK